MEQKLRCSVKNKVSHLIKNEMKDIREAFYHGEKARSRLSANTGPELSIARTLLEHHISSNLGLLDSDNGMKFYLGLKKCQQQEMNYLGGLLT